MLWKLSEGEWKNRESEEDTMINFLKMERISMYHRIHKHGFENGLSQHQAMIQKSPLHSTSHK